MENMYLETVEQIDIAETEIWNLKNALEIIDCSNETFEALCEMIDEETEDFESLDNLLCGSFEDLQAAYDAADDIINWCRSFNKTYELLIAEI